MAPTTGTAAAARASSPPSKDSNSYVPFPDLTGWRSTSDRRGASSSTICVSQRVDISMDELKRASSRLEASEPAQLMEAAWAIILLHILFQEGDARVVFHTGSTSHVDFSIPEIDRTSLTLSDILQQIKAGRTNEKGRIADNLVFFDFSSSPSIPDKTADLSLLFSASLAKERDGVCLSLSASPMVHNQSSAESHLSQVARCLEYICRAPKASASALTLEYFPQFYLAGDNARPEPITDDTCPEGLSVERFEDQTLRMAKAKPDSIALDFRSSLDAPAGEEAAGNVQWTYHELVSRAHFISSVIKKHLQAGGRTKSGAGDERHVEIVALCLEKSPFTYLSILAVLLSGAAWCPIDTDWPAARRAALLAKSGASIVLTAGDHVCASLEEVKPQRMQVVRLDKIDSSAELMDSPLSSNQLPSSEALAYLIWTSGTTGLPKAVGIQHKAAVQALRALQRVIPHDNDRFQYLQFSAYNFDLMILDMFYTWGLGGTLCSSSRSMLLTNLVPLSNKLNITHTLLTPAVLAMTPRESIPSLQVVINGGEKLSQVVADMWSVDCCLLNLYGPAEATLIAMNRRVPENDCVKSPNIGVALATTSCHAIDGADNIVLKGAVGQLVLGGHQCALGYIGEEAKTRDKFIEHPSLGRVYKTGDLVRQLWNGDFEYLGRTDDQIKVNGIRIELLEINAAIRGSSANVKDSETLVISNQEDDTQIVNFSVFPLSGSKQGDGVSSLIRTDEGAVKLTNELIASARSSLPSYMVPSLFVIVSYFPRTSSAKIDREALKRELASFDRIAWLTKLAGSSSNNGSDGMGLVKNEEEGTIQKHIASICGLSDRTFDRHTPFPSLGLNSIRAITLSHRLQLEGISLSVVDIVQNQTLAELSAHLQAGKGSAEAREEASAKYLLQFANDLQPSVNAFLQTERASIVDKVERVQPVTALQEALLLESARDATRYWLHREYTLPASIDFDRLSQALNTVVQRSEIFRTFFLPRSSLSEGKTTSEGFVSIVVSEADVTIHESTHDSVRWDPHDMSSSLPKSFGLNAIGSRPPICFLLVRDRHEPKLVALLHHVLYDQTTLKMMERALEAVYRGLDARPRSMLPFSAGLKYLVDGSKEQEEKRQNVWKQMLDSYPKGHSPKLPDLSDRRLERRLESSNEMFRYSRPTSFSFETASQAASFLQTSVRPILQAAWASVLCAYCDNTEDILIGDSISSRAAFLHLGEVAGPVLDTVPVPVNVQGSYRKVITQIDAFHKKAISNLPVPLRHIRKMLQVSNNSALFPTVFVFEAPEQEDSEDDRRDTGSDALFVGKRDVRLSVEHATAVEVIVSADGKMELALLAKDTAISPSSAELLLAQWEASIVQAMREPDSAVAERSSTCFSDHLLAISGSDVPDSLQQARSSPVFTALAKHAKAIPSQPAVDFYSALEENGNKDHSLVSYAELEVLSTAAAHRLLQIVCTKSVVAVSLSRSTMTYISLLAILKAGMVYLPIDPSLPVERKRHILEDSRAACLLWEAKSRFEMEVNKGKGSIQTIEADSLASKGKSGSSNPLPSIDPASPAYIIFTSGSTGKPKGCVLSHKNLSCTIEAFRISIERQSGLTLDESTRFLARSVEAFDVALLETLLPLQVGGTIVTGPKEVILEDLGRAMQAMQVTHAAVVPSLFYTASNSGTRRRRVVPSDLPLLRVLIVGGERIAQDIIKEWASSKVPLINAYGPSETCIGNSIVRLGPNDSTSNIGTPFPGTRYIVMKAKHGDLSPALRGEAGELCVAGLQVGSYLKQDQTASSFVVWKGTRMYRTGDEVRLLHDSTTEYIGRIDRDQSGGQVKIRGVRIELNEIDKVLQDSSDEMHYTCTRLLGQPERLITFVSPSAGSIEKIEVIRDTSLLKEAQRMLRVSRQKLPTYMAPQSIVSLQAIPLSSISGKMDVKRIERWYETQISALPDISEERSEAERPLTEQELVVREEVLKLTTTRAEPHIGADTDLFSLGLDSLNVMSLSNALKRRNIDADMAYIMVHPTIQEIAQGNEASGSLTSLEEDGQQVLDQARHFNRSGRHIISAWPLLPLQESIVTQTLADQSAGVTPRYINIVRMACKIHDVDRRKLEASIRQVIQAHRIYRSIFIETDGGMVQAVLEDDVPLVLDEDVDFEKRAVHDICSKIGTVPALRYCINKADDLMLAIHHAIYDGTSLSAFIQEVGQRYDGKAVQACSQFDEYVEHVSKTSMDTKLDNWLSLLTDYSLTPFPCLTGKREPPVEDGRRIEIEYQSNMTLTSLRGRAREQRVTLQLLVLDAFACLYSHYVGHEQVIFGLIMGGRTGPTSDVHGPCINTVPFAYNREGQGGLRKAQNMYGVALRNQHISLPSLARRLQSVNGKLFNTLFSYLGEQKTSDFFEEMSSSLTTEYPLAVEVEEDSESDKLILRVVCNPSFVPDTQASLLLQQLDSNLCGLSSGLSDRKGRQSSLMAIENEVPRMPSSDSGFLDQFRRQVEVQPDTIAYTFSSQLDSPALETTYGQLDRVSSEMAKSLSSIEGGVVGILMKQSTALYPLVIGVWKSGKAYLPLDPSLPFDRLEYIVGVAEPCLIVSSLDDVALANRLGEGMSVEQLVKPGENSKLSLSAVPIERAAYTMFTSGSSGKPKGVQVSHLALAAALESWREILPHSKHSRMLQLASPGFDVFLIEVCMPLALGFSFASAPKDVLLDDLEASFDKLGITIADLPAVLASTVRPEGIASQGRIEWLMSGGDQIDDAVIERWSPKGLVNAWGPTETTIGNSLGFVTPHSSRSWVGKAYPTSSIYILDHQSSEIVFRGCIGEIAIGGPQVADGYVKNEELTKEKFIYLDNGVRVYRTGDRGRLLTDGSLECLGRIDVGQVKINSQRVELREIEWQLEKSEGIADSCVLYTKHPELKTKQLVAFYIVEDDEEEGLTFGEVTLRRDANARKLVSATLQEASKYLAAYMVPTFSLVLSGRRFPLTPNNKVDTKRLESIYTSLSMKQLHQLDAKTGSTSSSPTSGSWTKTEEKLRELFAAFCNVDVGEIDRDVSFYRLGIDSISGYRLARRLSEDGGLGQVTLRDLLSNPTISLLAAYVDCQGRSDEPEHTNLRPVHCDTTAWAISENDAISAVLPCTPLQQGTLLETLVNGLYVHHHLFTIAADKIDAVISALDAMVKQTDMLRTSFHLVEEHFVQAIHSEPSFRLIDMGQAPDLESAASRLSSCKILTTEEELARSPIAMQYIRISKETIAIDLVMHHALYDGESLGMIFGELERRTLHLSVPSRPSFRTLLPYLVSRPEDVNFWVGRLHNASNTLVGTSGISSRSCVSSRRKLKLPLDTITQAAAQLDVTVPVVALYSFSKLLATLSGQRDVVFAQLFSLRDAVPEADAIIGPALNTVMTRVRIPSQESQSDTLSRLQKENDQGRAHRRASMVDVLRSVRKGRHGKTLDFDSLFDFQKSRNDEHGSEHAEILTHLNDQEDDSTQYALNVQFHQDGDGLSVLAVADSDIFAQDVLDGHLNTIEEIIKMVLADGSLPATDMPCAVPSLDSLPQSSSHEEADLSRGAMPVGQSAGSLTELQSTIIDILAEVTGLERDAFDTQIPITRFGLDSIMAIRVASALRRQGISVGVVDIVRGSTVEGISKRIDASSSSKGTFHAKIQSSSAMTALVAQVAQVPPDAIEDVLPLLPGQTFEMAESLGAREASAGVYSFFFKVATDTIDVGRLPSAWMQLVARHAVLRTAFAPIRGSLRQIIFKQGGDSWQTRAINGNLSDLLHDPAKANEWLKDNCGVNLTLHRPPVAACFVTANDGCFLILRLHHALYDAWAIDLLLKDLSCLCQKQVNLEEDTSRSSQYVDMVRHALSERDMISEEAKEYWSDLFRDVPPCIVGYAAQASAEMATYSTSTMLGKASATDAHLHKSGKNLATAFIAAWSLCLSNMNKDAEKVCFGLFRRGRTSDFAGVETTISNSMNILPIVARGKLDTNDISDLCSQIQEQMDEQMGFESSVGISDILQWTQANATPWNSYLNLLWESSSNGNEEQREREVFEAIDASSLLGSHTACRQEKDRAKNNVWEGVDLIDVRADFNINLHWNRTKDCVDIVVRYRNGLLSEEDVGRCIDDMISLASQAATSP